MKSPYGNAEKALKQVCALPWIHLFLCALVVFVFPGSKEILAKLVLLPLLAVLVPVGLVGAVLLWSSWPELPARSRWGLLLVGAIGGALDIGLGGFLMMFAME